MGLVRPMRDDQKTKILLIEDDPRLRVTLARMLESEGYQVVQAEEGSEGMRLFASEKPSLVVTDLIMPGKEGMETILTLRAKNPDLKIIAMSGGGLVRAAEYLPVAKAAGADLTLEKPFSIKKLIEAIQDLLAD